MHTESLFEQGTGTMNEDFLVVKDDLFGVFDGATSLDATTYDDGVTGGYLAATLAGRAFGENSGTLTELAGKANDTIRQSMAEHGVELDRKSALWSASAAVARIRDNALEWVQIGDCQILCLLKNGGYETLCRCTDQDEETLLLWQGVCRDTDEPIGKAMLEQIRKVRNTMNVQYGVFSGEPEAMNFLEHGTRSLEDVTHVLLFTDGLFPPNPDPTQDRDYSCHVRLFRKGGLQAIRDHIRAAEATDMGCRVYPRFKSHDDIAAIAVSL